jgi:hypothetical protein
MLFFVSERDARTGRRITILKLVSCEKQAVELAELTADQGISPPATTEQGMSRLVTADQGRQPHLHVHHSASSCRHNGTTRGHRLLALCAAALVVLANGFSNPDTSKPPGRDLPSGDKLRIGIVKRVDVSACMHFASSQSAARRVTSRHVVRACVCMSLDCVSPSITLLLNRPRGESRHVTLCVRACACRSIACRLQSRFFSIGREASHVTSRCACVRVHVARLRVAFNHACLRPRTR